MNEVCVFGTKKQSLFADAPVVPKKKEAFDKVTGKSLGVSQNNACLCADCQCGANCQCNLPNFKDDETCDPCCAFRTEKKLAEKDGKDAKTALAAANAAAIAAVDPAAAAPPAQDPDAWMNNVECKACD